MKILKMMGLMTVKEHDLTVQAEILQSIKASNRASDEKGFRIKAEKRADDWQAKHAAVVSKLEDREAKFKLAATDLENEVKERKRVQYDLATAKLEIAALRPDAEAWRAKKAKDGDYEKNRRVRKSKGEKR